MLWQYSSRNVWRPPWVQAVNGLRSPEQAALIKPIRGPKDRTNMRIPDSGSEALYKGTPEIIVCRIIMVYIYHMLSTIYQIIAIYSILYTISCCRNHLLRQVGL